MPKATLAIVEPSILKWARESAGYTVEDIAKRFKKDPSEIRAWESEDTEQAPYMGQLRNLANLYKRSISDFYLPEPPQEKPIPHDFRRSPGKISGLYPPELRKQLRFGRERQELAKVLSGEFPEIMADFKQKVDLNTDPEKVGQQIRSFLKVKYFDQSQEGDGRSAYNFWRRRIEESGILIFQFEKISSDEVWGFSLTERPFPVIAINIALSPNARTFTMLHELVHILLQENSICDIDDHTPRNQYELGVEAFCNHAAAAALMPKPEFIDHQTVASRSGPSTDWEDDEIRQIAKSFGISREAAVRRLVTFNKTTKKFYLLKRAQYQVEFNAKKKKQWDNLGKEIRRDYAQRAVSNLGRTFVSLILSSYNDKFITMADAAKYLDVGPHKVRKVQELTFGR